MTRLSFPDAIVTINGQEIFPDGKRYDATEMVIQDHHKRFLNFLEQLEGEVCVKVGLDGFYIKRIHR